MLATTETVTHQTAATTAASIHLHHQGEVVQTPLGSFAETPGVAGLAVLVPQQGLAEFFPADDQPLSTLGPIAATAAATGWDVAVLVPSERMGDAHRELRGFPLVLQAWWDEGDRICFGGPEVA